MALDARERGHGFGDESDVVPARNHTRTKLRWAIGLAGGVALVSVSAWAWNQADQSFANLWLTPDQQGAKLMARQQFAEAAQRFRDPLHQGVAFYRAGDFKSAAAAFARTSSPEAAFNRGNALVMVGKYADAIACYDQALRARPGWSEALANRELALARDKKLHPPQTGDEGTDGQLKADEIVFDNRPSQNPNSDQVEVVTGGQLSDADLQALWLRRVQTKPADFLRAKFAYQASLPKFSKREETPPP